MALASFGPFSLLMSNVDKLKQEAAVASGVPRIPSLHSIYNATSSQHGSHATLNELDQPVFSPNQGIIPKTVPRHINNVAPDYQGAHYDHAEDSDDEDALQMNWQTVVVTDNDVSISGHVSK